MNSTRPTYEYTYARSVSIIKDQGQELLVAFVSLSIMTFYMKDGRPWQRLKKGTPAIYIEQPVRDCPSYLLDLPKGDFDMKLDVFQYEYMKTLYENEDLRFWQLEE